MEYVYPFTIPLAFAAVIVIFSGFVLSAGLRFFLLNPLFFILAGFFVGIVLLVLLINYRKVLLSGNNLVVYYWWRPKKIFVLPFLKSAAIADLKVLSAEGGKPALHICLEDKNGKVVKLSFLGKDGKAFALEVVRRFKAVK